MSVGGGVFLIFQIYLSNFPLETDLWQDVYVLIHRLPTLKPAHL